MHGMREIIEEAETLPVEERTMIIDSLLKTLNPPAPGVEKEWLKVAGLRLAELQSGRVKGVSGEDVFAAIRKRF